jgi:cytochrome c1
MKNATNESQVPIHRIRNSRTRSAAKVGPQNWLTDPRYTKRLRAWIEEPDSIRPDTRMEPLNPKLPDRERVVEAIIAYLHAMVGTKPAPGAR